MHRYITHAAPERLNSNTKITHKGCHILLYGFGEILISILA